jgi:multidrug transporter EmrE-like cation transporter
VVGPGQHVFLAAQVRGAEVLLQRQACASSWQGWVIVSILITGTVAYFAKALQHLVFAVAYAQSTNFGNARTPIRST